MANKQKNQLKRRFEIERWIQVLTLALTAVLFWSCASSELQASEKKSNASKFPGKNSKTSLNTSALPKNSPDSSPKNPGSPKKTKNLEKPIQTIKAMAKSPSKAVAPGVQRVVKLDFKTCETKNLDNSTYPGSLSLSGAYSPDSETNLLLHFNNPENSQAYSSFPISFSGRGFTYGGEGKYGKALLCDGSGGLIIKPKSGSWPKSIFQKPDKFTLEAWFMVDITPKKGCALLSLGGYQSGYRVSIGRYATIVFQIGRGKNSKSFKSKRNAIKPLCWQHLAIAYDASLPSKNVTIRIDGNLDKAYDYKIPVLPVIKDPFRIGGAGGMRSFKGEIDEVRWSSVARTQEQLAASPRSDYFASGEVVSPVLNQKGEKVVKAAIKIAAEKPEKSGIKVFLSNDDGKTWLEKPESQSELSFPKSGDALRVKIELLRGYGTPILKSCEIIYN